MISSSDSLDERIIFNFFLFFSWRLCCGWEKSSPRGLGRTRSKHVPPWGITPKCECEVEETPSTLLDWAQMGKGCRGCLPPVQECACEWCRTRRLEWLAALLPPAPGATQAGRGHVPQLCTSSSTEALWRCARGWGNRLWHHALHPHPLWHCHPCPHPLRRHPVRHHLPCPHPLWHCPLCPHPLQHCSPQHCPHVPISCGSIPRGTVPHVPITCIPIPCSTVPRPMSGFHSPPAASRVEGGAEAEKWLWPPPPNYLFPKRGVWWERVLSLCLAVPLLVLRADAGIPFAWLRLTGSFLPQQLPRFYSSWVTVWQIKSIQQCLH